MTVQELLKSVDKKQFIDYYVNLSKLMDCKVTKKLVEHFYDQLVSTEVIEDDNTIVFAVPVYHSVELDSFLVEKKSLKDKRVETYAYDVCDPHKVLGYSISNACRYCLNDDIRYAAAIFWELSFFGYSLETQEECANKFIEDINKSVEEIKNKTVNLINAEDVFKHLGYKDERSAAEKSFDDNTHKIQHKFESCLLKELYKLEQKY